eukprot:gene5301-6601_t
MDQYSSPVSSLQPVLRAYLCKKGHVVKNWKLRLFVLKPGTNFMEYFVDETKESQHQPQGKIPLFGCKVVEYVHNKNNNPREFCFIIETIEGKTWIISASSKAQQIQWIESIREAASLAEESDEIKIQKHRQIEKMLLNDSKKKQKTPILKLLLLGAGESGKSTIVKQMKILHHQGFTPEEQEFYRHLIHKNLLEGLALLVFVVKEHNIELSSPETQSAINNFSSWWSTYRQKHDFNRKLSSSLPYSSTTATVASTSPPTPPYQSPPQTPPSRSPRSSSPVQNSSPIQQNSNNTSPKNSFSIENTSTTTNLEQNFNSLELNDQQPKTHSRSNSDPNSNIFNVENGIPPIICNYIITIWSDAAVQNEAMIQAQNYHINESTTYYLNEIKRIAKPNYVPTSLDILKSRSTTNGVVETDFKVSEVIFRIVDVAGQRGERKKWINFFDDVTAIVFVAAINEYDQKLVEDNSTNRLHESLNLFDQICNDPVFPRASIILFLNKIDLFREKLKRTSITVCFPDYRDDQSYDKSSNYIKNSFLSKKRGGNNDPSKHIYFHFTCATDTKSFETVFNSVQDIIISKTLELYLESSSPQSKLSNNIIKNNDNRLKDNDSGNSSGGGSSDLPNIESLQYDQSYLRVISDVDFKFGVPNIALQIWYLSDACYKCTYQLLTTLNNTDSSDYFVIDTTFPQTFSAKVVDARGVVAESSLMPFSFGEFAIYDLYINTTSNNIGSIGLAHELKTIKEPVNSYIPIAVLFGILVGMSIVWPIIMYYYKKSKRDSLEYQLQNLDSNDPKKDRLKSLDVFRGFSITIMIFVNYGGGGYWFFNHSYWNGLTVADLVFPWFIFIMGVAMPLSFNALEKRGVPKHNMVLKLIKRSIILFALGLFINNGFHITHWRILGVLQRFGVSYLVTGLIMLFVPLWRYRPIEDFHHPDGEAHQPLFGSNNNIQMKSLFSSLHSHGRLLADIVPFWLQWVVVLLLLATWFLVTFLLDVPGCPKGYLGPGGIGDNGLYKDCTGGAARLVDLRIFGNNHIFQTPTCQPIYKTGSYDPEGTLGYLTSIVMCFLGVQAGRTILIFKSNRSRLVRWFIWATVLCSIAAGLCNLSQNDGRIPINKNLWTPSFIFLLSGFAFIVLFILYVLVDIKRIWNGAPFLYVGMNPITIYCGHEILGGYFPFSFYMSQITHSLYLLSNCIVM